MIWKKSWMAGKEHNQYFLQKSCHQFGERLRKKII